MSLAHVNVGQVTNNDFNPAWCGIHECLLVLRSDIFETENVANSLVTTGLSGFEADGVGARVGLGTGADVETLLLQVRTDDVVVLAASSLSASIERFGANNYNDQPNKFLLLHLSGSLRRGHVNQ
jgi:hypothetical protein